MTADLNTPGDGDGRRRRLTQSDIIAALLQKGGDRSSVSIARNAKGGHQIEVTGRTADEPGMRSLPELAWTVRHVYDALRLDFPEEADQVPVPLAAGDPELDEIRARAARWLAETPTADDTPTQLAHDITVLLQMDRVARSLELLTQIEAS